MNVRSVPFSGVRPGASYAWKSQQFLLLFPGFVPKEELSTQSSEPVLQGDPSELTDSWEPRGSFNISLLCVLTSVQTHLSPTADLFSFYLLTLCSKENGELLKDLKYVHEGRGSRVFFFFLFSHHGNKAKNGKGRGKGG